MTNENKNDGCRDVSADRRTANRQEFLRYCVLCAITLVGCCLLILVNQDQIEKQFADSVDIAYRSATGPFCTDDDYYQAKARVALRQSTGTAHKVYEPCYHGAGSK